MELDTKQLTEYLEHVSKLETSVYEQERFLEEARSKVVLTLPEPEIIPEPEMEVVKDRTEEIRNKQRTLRKKKHTVLLVFGIIFSASTIGAIVNGEYPAAVTALILGIVFFALYFSKKKKAEEIYNQTIEDLNKELADNKESIESAKEFYEFERKQYKIDVEEAKRNQSKAAATAKKDYEEACVFVGKMEATLYDTKRLLDNFYIKDVLFPKYRNMVAVCTIYEYFQTGRCTELTGADGAYNLYEFELRQNRVIDQLDNVIERLDSIKNNQFYLYTELQSINQNVSGMSASLSDMLVETKKISAYSKANAYYSAITAEIETVKMFL